MANPHPLASPVGSLRAWLASDEYRCLVVALGIVWGGLDTVTTALAVVAHGTAKHEINPLMRTVLETDLRLFVGLKLCAVCLGLAIALRGRPAIQAVPWWRHFFALHLSIGTVVVIINSITTVIAL